MNATRSARIDSTIPSGSNGVPSLASPLARLGCGLGVGSVRACPAVAWPGAGVDGRGVVTSLGYRPRR